MNPYKDLRIRERLFFISLLLFLFVLIFNSFGCSFLKARRSDGNDLGKIKTKQIIFQCDKVINQGLLLPVDVIYVTRYHRPREVIAIGPNKWFNSLQRERWETKQTLGFTGGETKTLKLNKLWLKNSKLIIIFANFKDVKDPGSQQVIIDRSGKRKKKILVMPRHLEAD